MHAAVLGSPITHSKSPVLHLAAYRALGLDNWTYERIECTPDRLADLVHSLGPDWAGLSVTMPNKVVALAFADERTDRAVLAGSANTLVRSAAGWRADCTDVDGVVGALRDAGLGDLGGESALVVGAGGTARPSLVGLAELGARAVTVVARSAERAADTLACAAACGLDVTFVPFDDVSAIAGAAARARIAVSTVPAAAAAPIADAVACAPTVLDAIYDPWPTPVADAVAAAGGTVISGLEMLLNQAFGQVEQFTGSPAPRAVMRAALVGVRDGSSTV